MREEMIRLAQIAESFEKDGDIESGRIVTEAMMQVQSLNWDFFGMKDKIMKKLETIFGNLSQNSMDAIAEILMNEFNAQR